MKGLKKHGMFVADNGIDWAISVAPDERIGNLHEGQKLIFELERGQQGKTSAVNLKQA